MEIKKAVRTGQYNHCFNWHVRVWLIIERQKKYVFGLELFNDSFHYVREL